VLWQFDTNRAFETVNGVKATGASIDGSPLVIGNGMIFVNSGYGGIRRAAGQRAAGVRRRVQAVRRQRDEDATPHVGFLLVLIRLPYASTMEA
jgi:hypothetical protein